LATGPYIQPFQATYAQGAVAELVAMATSPITSACRSARLMYCHRASRATMAANRSGLQTKTLRNLLWAWVLTFPACVVLGAMTFALGLYFVLNVFGLQ
jgi:PiT family inorganic phosphate transporter